MTRLTVVSQSAPQTRMEALRAELEQLTLEQIDGALAATEAARRAWVEVSEGTAPDAIKDRARRVAELFRVEGDGLRAMRERMEQ